MAGRWNAVLLGALAMLAAYFFVAGRRETDVLKDRVHLLEKRITAMKAQCDARTVFLKTQERGTDRGVDAGTEGRPILDFFGRFGVKPGRTPSETILEMKKALGLDEAGAVAEEVDRILAEFRRKKHDIFVSGSRDGGFVLNPLTVDKVNALRREALQGLKSVLSEEQYSLMKKRDYDKALGLRISQQ